MIKIKINKEYLLQVEYENEIIKVNEKEWNIPSIQFDVNEIKIGKEEEENIIQKILENPLENQIKEIEYNETIYSLEIDYLLSLILYWYVVEIEKKGNTIQQTRVELPTNNTILIKRIKDICKQIGLSNIQFSNKEEQKNQMKEIIEHYTKYTKEFKEPMKIIKEIVKKEKKEDECCYLDQLEINNEYGIEDMNLLKKEMKLLQSIPLSIKRIFIVYFKLI